MVRKILVTNLKSFQVFHEKSIIAKVTIPVDIIAHGIIWRKDPLQIVPNIINGHRERTMVLR